MHRPPRDTDKTRLLRGLYQHPQVSTSRPGAEGGHARSVGAWSGAMGNPTSAATFSSDQNQQPAVDLQQKQRCLELTFRLDSLVIFPIDGDLDGRKGRAWCLLGLWEECLSLRLSRLSPSISLAQRGGLQTGSFPKRPRGWRAGSAAVSTRGSTNGILPSTYTRPQKPCGWVTDCVGEVLRLFNCVASSSRVTFEYISEIKQTHVAP